MRTSVWTCVVILFVVLLIAAGMSFGVEDGAKDKPAREVVKNGPKDIPPGWERVVFIHYKKPRDKPADKPGKKPPENDSQCYTFLAKGVKWENPSFSAFKIDTANAAGLDGGAVFAAISAAAGTWDDETVANIFSCTPGNNLAPDWDDPDGVNEVVFGDLDIANAIAATIVWGIFGGPPSEREILEFDVIFDDVDFDWSASTGGVEGKMDLQNIATHELGHGVGLGDLYGKRCAEATMYGYSAVEETMKRSLEPGDIAGLVALYGN